ncbi:MAG: ABC transporter permease [Planctomycetes bacterium]|nr:ABC transporter permease [Planctomycetota bacterium]
MKIPLRYSIRNLMRRKVRTLLTLFAVVLVVAVSVVMFAFAGGLLNSARNSGSPDNIIVIDRKAANQTFSKISKTDYNLLKGLPQIRKNALGEPLISPETLQDTRVSVGEHENRPGVVRGVSEKLFEVNTLLRMVEGEPPSPGRNLVVGSLTHTALGVPRESLVVGNEIVISNDTWKIVGRFDASGTAMDSEILMDLNDSMAVFVRDSYSSALIKLEHEGEMPTLIQSLNSRNDIQVKAVAEREYYRDLAEGFERIILLAVFLAVIATIGGLVSGMNTMYASVLGRIREIGTLKTLGYPPKDIVQSFVLESTTLALMGGAIGMALAWQANGISTKFNKGAFSINVDEWALLAGLVVALVIGIFGALFPAIKGARMKIPEALHYS